MKKENLEKLLFEVCNENVDKKTQRTILFMIENGLNIDNIINQLNDSN